MDKVIDLAIDLPSENINIEVDELRTRQILVNLLSNAVKFTPERGKVSLIVSFNAKENWVQFAIQDTGIGIAPENLPHLFQSFYQVESGHTRQYTGSGLGLALAKRMAEAHEGEIQVKSTLGQGSCFTVFLPCLITYSSNSPKNLALTSSLENRSLPNSSFQNTSPSITSPVSDTRFVSSQSEYTRSENYQLVNLLSEDLGSEDLALEDLGSLASDDLVQQGTNSHTPHPPAPSPNKVEGESDQSPSPHLGEGFRVRANLRRNLLGSSQDLISDDLASEDLRSEDLGSENLASENLASEDLRSEDLDNAASESPQLEQSPSETFTRQVSEPLSILSADSPEPSNPFPAQSNPPVEDDRLLILLAEDNEANIQTFSRYLTHRGFRVITALNGQEAIDRVEQEKPHCILMDMQMPIMDGFQAMQILRSNPKFDNVPIIALTALAMAGDREKCLQAGADDYLEKPVYLKAIVETIERLVASSRP